MERRLLANSICLLLASALTAVAGAQTVKRESSDPYFQSQNSWNASANPRQPAATQLQPRRPVAQQQLAPRQTPARLDSYPLQPKPQPTSQFQQPAQLQPMQSNNVSLESNRDFRPRSVQSSQMKSPRFNNGDGSFRPRNQQPASSQLQPIQPETRKPIFEEAKPAEQIRFNQSEEFETPERFQLKSQPAPAQRPPSNPQRDFTQATSSGASALTTTEATQASPQVDEFEPGRVVAIVGGEPIFVGDMLFEVNQFLNQAAPNAPEQIKAAQRKIIIKKMIPKFIDQKLLLIDTLNSLPPEADFDAVVQSAEADFDEKVLPTVMEKSNVASPLELDAKLRAQGGSLRQLRYKWAEEQLIKYFIGQKLDINTDVSHQEMLADYQANLDQYHQKSKVRWEELAIRFDKVPNREEATQLIKKMGNEVVYGASFEAVARKSSQGFTASDGGKHDWTSKGALVYKDVEQALFSIPPNQLSDVIPSQHGLHIVRVLERSEETYTPFLEAQIEIKVKLENEKRSKAFEDHIAKLRSRIPFEVQLEDVQLPEHLANQGSNFR
jgi:hypothetical protein